MLPAKVPLLPLLKAFANEWAQHGITVNGIAPGYIATDNTTQLEKIRKEVQQYLQEFLLTDGVLQKIWQVLIVFLSSSASDYVNGTILTVDGGWMGR